MIVPKTQYAKSGDIHIAYQVVGNGPRDLIFAPGWISNIEVIWEEPAVARFLERLASFSRLILFDKRGTGLSDRVPDVPGLHVRIEDVRAVMHAVGSEHATLFGSADGGTMCMLFAATYPKHTSALILANSFARLKPAPGYRGSSLEELEWLIEECERDWGGPLAIDGYAPTMAEDARFRQWWAQFLRMSANPAAAIALLRMSFEFDVRDVLSVIRTPTLSFHGARDTIARINTSLYVERHILGTKSIDLPGPDHLPFFLNADVILDETEKFVTSVSGRPLMAKRKRL